MRISSLRLCERIGTGTEFLGPGGFHQAQQQMIIEVGNIASARTRNMGPPSHVKCLCAFANIYVYIDKYYENFNCIICLSVASVCLSLIA